MQVYLRYIHKISQSPEADTLGPFTINGLDIDQTWQWLYRTQGVKKSYVCRDHRAQDGGLVYFLHGVYHSLLVMPIGSELHKKHAPPSHFKEGGPLHEKSDG